MLKLGVAKNMALGDVAGTLKGAPGAVSSAFSSASHNGGGVGVLNQIWGNVDVLDDAAKINRASNFAGTPGASVLNGPQLFAGQIPNSAISGAGFVDTYITDFIPTPSGPDVTGTPDSVGDFSYREEEARYKAPECRTGE